MSARLASWSVEESASSSFLPAGKGGCWGMQDRFEWTEMVTTASAFHWVTFFWKFLFFHSHFVTCNSEPKEKLGAHFCCYQNGWYPLKSFGPLFFQDPGLAQLSFQGAVQPKGVVNFLMKLCRHFYGRWTPPAFTWPLRSGSRWASPPWCRSSTCLTAIAMIVWRVYCPTVGPGPQKWLSCSFHVHDFKNDCHAHAHAHTHQKIVKCLIIQ